MPRIHPNVEVTWNFSCERVPHFDLYLPTTDCDVFLVMSHLPVKLRASPQERFWKKVVKTDRCWEWIGAVTTAGYGVFQKGRRGEKLHKAHRFSFELHFGSIPKGLLVLHTCDNKRCVCPSHLELGDHSKNIKDAWDRGLRSPSIWNMIGFAKARHAKTKH